MLGLSSRMPRVSGVSVGYAPGLRAVAARRGAEVHSRRPSPDRVAVSIGSGLTADQRRVPLSTTVRLPADWQEVSISGEADLRLVQDGEVDLEIVPDGLEVIIERTR